MGCGDPRAASTAGTTTTSPSQEVAAEIASVALGADGASLVVGLESGPIDASADCVVDLMQRVEFEEDRIHLGVTYVVAPPDEIAGGHCDAAPPDVRVALKGTLAGRHVITQDPVARWVPTTTGGYRRCELPDCDAGTGQTPLAATCEDGTLAAAARSGDVPRHAGLANTRCEAPWAVLDIDIGAAACPASDSLNPCAGTWVRRTYWQTTTHTWEQVGASVGPGCGDIAAVVPEFPTDLCHNLPALP